MNLKRRVFPHPDRDLFMLIVLVEECLVATGHLAWCMAIVDKIT